MNALHIFGGSHVGHLHARAGRNNQDAWHVSSTTTSRMAVVTDGCGSSAHSETGAQLAAHLLCIHTLYHLNTQTPDARTAIEQGLEATLNQLSGLLPQLHPEDTGHALEVLQGYLLFTLVGALIHQGKVNTFSLGDGVIELNGVRTDLGPFPENAPPYACYRILAPAARPPGLDLELQHHHCVPVEELETLLIGTDGVRDLWKRGELTSKTPLEDLWTDPRFRRNPDMVRRSLAQIQRSPKGPWLPDDTTLVAVVHDREAAS